MSEVQGSGVASPADGQPADEVKLPPRAPEPTASGSDQIAVLRHSFSEIDGVRGEGYAATRVDLAIRNVSVSTIATAVFEAVFYDSEGNVVDTVRHRETELDPDTSRLIHITSSVPIYERDDIASYSVRLVRAATADAERIQARRHEISTTDSGEEEVRGVVKNLSSAMADAAVVATFYDAEKENIGVRVLVVKGIEPKSARRYTLRFRPPEGETVSSCNVVVGELAAS